MSLYIASVAVVVSMMILQAVIFIFIVRQQQRTIERLTDRIMVMQGHREYQPTQPDGPPERKRKPMSFFDDPNIEEEEEMTS